MPETKAVEIECEYTGAEHFRSFGKAQKGTFHYRVIVPKGYAAEPERRYPCLFSMGPGGGGGTGKAEKWLKDNQWIIIQLVEARNGPWEPIFGCFLAAHDDAVKRLRLCETQKYATGFSGGSRASSLFVHLRPGFAGLWCQGSGFAAEGNNQWVMPPAGSGLAVFGSFGTADGNNFELNYMKRTQLPFAYEIHDGGHSAPPSDAMERVFDWFEQQLYLNNPAAKITPAQAAAFFAKRQAAFTAAATPFAKYRQAVVLQKLAAKYPALGPSAQPILAQLPALETNAVVRQEKAAQAAYAEAQNTELRLRTGGQPTKNPGDPNADAKLLKLYTELAAKYKDTESGQLAATRATNLAAPGKDK